MKTAARFLLSIAMLASTTPLFATDDASFDKVKKEAGETFDAVSDYSLEQRDTAIEKTAAALKKMDQAIDEMEASLAENWADLSEATRQRKQKSLATMRKKRNELAEWYGAMKHGSGEAWDKVTHGFGDAWDSLSKAWDDATE